MNKRLSQKHNDNARLINQDSGNYEYYTPIKIVEAAREVMGSIDLDPASSEQANERIKAERIYTKDLGVYRTSIGSFNRGWHGNIWLNHPFSRKENKLWITKLIREYQNNHITQACCITYAATSEIWFQPLLHYPQCFLSPRTNYYLPDGSLKKGVTKGSVVTYLGSNVEKFNDVFSEFGVVK